jgi:hypothetical protein
MLTGVPPAGVDVSLHKADVIPTVTVFISLATEGSIVTSPRNFTSFGARLFIALDANRTGTKPMKHNAMAGALVLIFPKTGTSTSVTTLLSVGL